jgi:FlaG/FlaF family flagellin (archaellin)
LKKVIVNAQVANRITAVNVDTASDSYTITFADGTTISGSGEFSEDGTPTSLSDDAGNEVVFSLGNPIGAKDADGNMVDITVGGA